MRGCQQIRRDLTIISEFVQTNKSTVCSALKRDLDSETEGLMNGQTAGRTDTDPTQTVHKYLHTGEECMDEWMNGSLETAHIGIKKDGRE